MNRYRHLNALFLLLAALVLGGAPAAAEILPQCPGDTNGDGISDTPGIVCMHLTSGDGFIKMADGKVLYTFGFSDVTGVPNNKVAQEGLLAATFPAPLIALDEGDQFYLSLSNVGFVGRPDLFDPHTVHFHGFPQASAIFDGLPESAIAINIGATATYYYKLNDPGTYMYHCHAEATEHMQMGMLGNLFVRPKQNKLPTQTFPNGFQHVQRVCNKQGRCTGNQYAYNDGDGSTYYDVELALHVSSMDGNFHDASVSVQPLPFALLKDNYMLLNGRGYPDTVNPNPLPAPAENGGKVSQSQTSLIRATAGQKILLRLSNLNVTNTYTIGVLGIPMKVVGRDAKLLRGPGGVSQYYTTNSISLGSGETADVILNTAGIAPGTYVLYATELNYLSNDAQDFGGMMTEIVIQ